MERFLYWVGYYWNWWRSPYYVDSEHNMSNFKEMWRKEPLLMQQAVWPHVKFSAKQIEIIHSVRDNVETVVPAGNMLGD